jgi:hypothetical protein
LFGFKISAPNSLFLFQCGLKGSITVALFSVISFACAYFLSNIIFFSGVPKQRHSKFVKKNLFPSTQLVQTEGKLLFV